MPLVKRFDIETSVPITPKEIYWRWVEFHRSIRAMSGTPFQRVAGRILGEDTVRYKVARFLFRPFLRLARRAKKRAAPAAKRAVATKADTVFPVNYRPRTIDYVAETAALAVDTTDVWRVVVRDGVDVASWLTELNDRLNETTAEWLFVVDESIDSLAADYTLATLLSAATSEDDVVFSDEHGPDAFAPILKSPAVGPHTLLSYDVVGRPALVRVETLFRVGGLNAEAGWAFEHDAYLRLSEARSTFRHVNQVLPAGRPASAFEAERIDDDTLRAVARALERRGVKGTLAIGELSGLVRWSLQAPSEPTIDIIIPTRDRLDLVKRCLASIEEITTYPNYNIIILDNDSAKRETLDFFAMTKYRVVPCPGPFNYAHIVNRGVAHSEADYVVTLNNDTVVVTPDWLEQLLALASLPDVGIAGACLLDADGEREHEGIVIAPYPQHLRTDTNYPHVDRFSLSLRDVAAVTGAVQMVERSFWNALGGMDEQLRVVMNDVDVCLRSLLEGRYVVYTPFVQLVHHVGSSRGGLDPIDDRDRFIRRWDIFGSFRDPFFPESLTILGEKVFYLPR